MMRIILDAMGGDLAPLEIVRGAVEATREWGVEITLVGRGEDILTALKEMEIDVLPPKLEISHADTVIGMEESPSKSIKEKPDSSMVRAVNLLAEGAGDALVSAGNTGALLSASTFFVKRIKGVRRAALAPFLPCKTGRFLLIDCGANVECLPEYLLQFAIIGSLYIQKEQHIPRPRVGLLNIGTEETKGTSLQKETYPLLQKAHNEGKIHFVGNVEARDVVLGAADVVVTDGYCGNILLKTMEGAGLFFVDMVKALFTKNFFTKMAALMMRGGLHTFRKTLDYAETGGTPILGLTKPVIKAHGSSSAKAIKNAIHQAELFASSGVIADIIQKIPQRGEIK